MGLSAGAIAAGVAGTAMSAMSSGSAGDQATDNYNAYLRRLKPNAKEKAAMRKRGTARIDADFLGANKDLSQSLASRGLGGGTLASGSADLTRAREAALGDLETNVEIFGFGRPPGAPAPVTQSTGDAFMSGLGGMAQYLGGMGLSRGMKW